MSILKVDKFSRKYESSVRKKIMNVSGVNSTTSTQKGKKIGTVAGFGVGGAYVAKNGKDIFQSGINALKSADSVSVKKAKAIALGVCTAVVGGLALVGRITGGLIGKAIDKKNEKQMNINQQVADAVQKVIDNDNVKTYSIDELKAELEK